MLCLYTQFVSFQSYEKKLLSRKDGSSVAGSGRLFGFPIFALVALRDENIANTSSLLGYFPGQFKENPVPALHGASRQTNKAWSNL